MQATKRKSNYRGRTVRGSLFILLLALFAAWGILATPRSTVAVSSQAPLKSAPFAPCGTTNVAQASNGGTIQGYSSNYGGLWDVHNLIDGTSSNGWSTRSFQTANQYVIVGLTGGGTYTINAVQINGSATQGDSTTNDLRDFQVRVSTTDTQLSSFTTVYSGTSPRVNGIIGYGFAPVQAKYVMLFAVNNYGGSYLEAAEFGVYTDSTCTPTPTRTNTATPFQSTATATPIIVPCNTNVAQASNGGTIQGYSSNYGGLWDVHNLIDGTSSNGWSTQGFQTTNQYVIAGLSRGDIYTINAVQVNGSATQGDSTTNDLRDFQVRVSTTDTQLSSFTTVYSGTSPRVNGIIGYGFAPVQAKYVMLFAVNNYGGSYLEAAEFGVYNACGAP